MGFLKPKMPKAPTVAETPPPPIAPMYAPKRNMNVKRGALGGTFLTQGMKLGMASVGKSLLGG
jgi:hypothetical protein